jgi:hypothetical protein
MEQIVFIIDLLGKLDFNFWQIFALVVLMLFRKQITLLLRRVTSYKGPMGDEVIFKLDNSYPEKSQVIEKMEFIKNKISLLPVGDDVKNDISKGLQSLNNEILIEALERIKNNTTFLWPQIVSAYLDQKTSIHAEIRKETFLIIRNDLELLKNFSLLEYTYVYSKKAHDNDIGLLITVEIKDDSLFEIIKLILDRNVSRPVPITDFSLAMRGDTKFSKYSSLGRIH